MIAQHRLHRMANILGLLLICIILTLAFSDQLAHHDLPCPLCLLQRVAFVAVGLCFCMNLQHDIKTTHYGLMLISALLGFALSLRQIFLHVAPGNPGYGDLFLRLHFYNWSSIIFLTIILMIAIALLLERGFMNEPVPPAKLTMALMIFFMILILANSISTLLECGFKMCPDNPIKYHLLSCASSV